MDLDYPIHRYFRWAKVLELTLGGASPSLAPARGEPRDPTRRGRLGTLHRTRPHGPRPTPHHRTRHHPGGTTLKHTRARAVPARTSCSSPSAACARDDGGTSRRGRRRRGDQPTTAAAGRRRRHLARRTAASATSRRCARTATPAVPPHRRHRRPRSRVGTVTDKGCHRCTGLNEEMYDTAVAFAEWCNEHGGILGREIVARRRSTPSSSSTSRRITEACEQDFALVGGGAVFDEDPNDVRVGCDLPNIAGYVVSARGRTADLQVQPLPNPIYDVVDGPLQRGGARLPRQRRQVRDHGVGHPLGAPREAAVDRGGRGQAASRSPTSSTTRPRARPGWANFVAEMKDKDVKILEFVGQPPDLVALTDEMDDRRTGTRT